ncbi:hypothetical protein C2G38_2280194 [Gigaspora rosea]|uniref:Uncharacterized protein n=1 Tax=Gigaspora rosea TaxID=44941 RepID=A0A397UEP5_9GLOM|nr:hypothetical protein C2G38_2280194 [Gigaspora rosea]
MSSVIYPTSQPVIPMPSGNNSLNQIMTLLQEIVSVVKNSNNNNNYTHARSWTDGNRQEKNRQPKKGKEKAEGKKRATRKKPTKPAEPPVMTKIQPYLIMTDLQNKKADITYAQLFQAVPNIRKEALKILRLGRTTRTRVAEVCLNKNEETYKISLYCEAQVKGKPIILILDSGSLDCVVSAVFLKEAGISID